MNALDYASLEASKRLAEAGIVLETEAVWFCPPCGTPRLVFSNDPILKAGFTLPQVYPAPSMAEVWRELPDNIQQIRCVPVLWREIDTYYVTYMQDFRGVSRFFHSHNPTDALIDLLIWVRKEAKDGR